jgi:hypothetical protein
MRVGFGACRDPRQHHKLRIWVSEEIPRAGNPHGQRQILIFDGGTAYVCSEKNWSGNSEIALYARIFSSATFIWTTSRGFLFTSALAEQPFHVLLAGRRDANLSLMRLPE